MADGSGEANPERPRRRAVLAALLMIPLPGAATARGVLTVPRETWPDPDGDPESSEAAPVD